MVGYFLFTKWSGLSIFFYSYNIVVLYVPEFGFSTRRMRAVFKDSNFYIFKNYNMLKLWNMDYMIKIGRYLDSRLHIHNEC
jgi:hypothetical protein